jgi:hypothetical protein
MMDDRINQRNDEAELLRREKETMERELIHLLAYDIPKQWQQLLHQLSVC